MNDPIERIRQIAYNLDKARNSTDIDKIKVELYKIADQLEPEQTMEQQ